jgi:hypothetical protein
MVNETLSSTLRPPNHAETSSATISVAVVAENVGSMDAAFARGATVGLAARRSFEDGILVAVDVADATFAEGSEVAFFETFEVCADVSLLAIMFLCDVR